MIRQKIPATPSIRRLPQYLHIIRQAQSDGFEYISGTIIAQELNLEPIQVRKDLAITGIMGKPKKGYPVAALITAIEHFLCWDKVTNTIVVGAGNLGSALVGYQDFQHHGLHIVACFDADAEKIGTKIHGVPVYSIDTLGTRIKKLAVSAAILTVPSEEAQRVANILVNAGIRAIWNFTNVKLKVPENIIVQREDLTSGYALLCVMMNSANEARVKE
ncbi:MAG: redox-sensing transcriptional repressor Rex [Spirochaetaceae bacterium]|jgi:redox-sensing transcriptional repressor|nr:redox-sensing transcriptional repressor Rex [Spirochaetaceae bacterium]